MIPGGVDDARSAINCLTEFNIITAVTVGKRSAGFFTSSSNPIASSPRDQRELIRAVSLPADFQPSSNTSRMASRQRENQRDGRRVMVKTVLAPIIHRRRQVEIPALHSRLALAKNFSAAGLTVIGDIPGGALIAFCDPLKQMSMRSRST